MRLKSAARAGVFVVCAAVAGVSHGFGAAKGIDGFRVVNPSHYQVFSQRGIGAFNLIAQKNTRHSVCFFYADAKPYTRLEGVTIAMTTDDGDQQLMDFEVKNGCVLFDFAQKENRPLQIEFVDVYR